MKVDKVLLFFMMVGLKLAIIKIKIVRKLNQIYQ